MLPPLSAPLSPPPHLRPRIPFQPPQRSILPLQRPLLPLLLPAQQYYAMQERIERPFQASDGIHRLFEIQLHFVTAHRRRSSSSCCCCCAPSSPALGLGHGRRREGHALDELGAEPRGEGAEDGLRLCVTLVAVAETMEDGAGCVSEEGRYGCYGGRVEGGPFGRDGGAGDLPGEGC